MVFPKRYRFFLKVGTDFCFPFTGEPFILLPSFFAKSSFFVEVLINDTPEQDNPKLSPCQTAKHRAYIKLYVCVSLFVCVRERETETERERERERESKKVEHTLNCVYV